MSLQLAVDGLTTIWQALEASFFGVAIRESLWLFPAIETVHLLAMAVLVSTIGAFDLRLLGVALRGTCIQPLAQRLFPWAWAAFLIQLVTGFLLFSSEATKMAVNPAFRLKMLLIVLAGLHALAFRLFARHRMRTWNATSQTPILARLSGLLSLALWIAVVAAGRWIGFI
jgi:hypothetical protein